MKYLSLFSGIGGLEADTPPELFCEIDPVCREVLEARHPNVEVYDDVRRLSPTKPVDVVVGGWPCQDISVAGKQAGLTGARSGLFYELVRIAWKARAHTLLAENVPNLLTLDDGHAFRAVLDELHKFWPFVGWRTVNVREFGLPHQRRRVLIVASELREVACGVHRPLPAQGTNPADYRDGKAAGFYWTAGLHSICYSFGYTPTLKVGSALSIPSPPAVHVPGRFARKLSPWECLHLQGFASRKGFEGLAAKDLYRMAGNAVARPMGRWLFGALDHRDTLEEMFDGGDIPFCAPERGFPASGLSMQGALRSTRTVHHAQGPLASNLGDYIDTADASTLSPRASAGLLKRLAKSGKPVNDDLARLLARYAREAR